MNTFCTPWLTTLGVMDTSTQHTSPTPDTSGRQPRRTRTWWQRVRSGVAAMAAAGMVAVGGAGFMTAQDASAAGVSQHNYAIISASQSQSSTTQNGKDSDDD